MIITIQDHNGVTKKVGNLQDGVFVKTVQDAKHRMRAYDAYAIERDVVNMLENICDKVKIFVTDKNEIWETSYKNLVEHGFVKSHPPYKEQVFLPRKHWAITNPTQSWEPND